jgi:uncharacterized protein YbjT (DUF2867 family)
VAHHLLQRGLPVRAAVRNSHAPEALHLRNLGAEIAICDLDDATDVEIAMRGVHGVYSVQSWENGVEIEIAQGIRVAEAAHLAKVDFLVYSSVAGADRNTGVPHFESKFVVEGRIAELGLRAAILRPVYFMENFLAPAFLTGMEQGVLRVPLPPEVGLEVIAVTDIGMFAAEAFEHPGEWTGRTVEIAGDKVTMPQVASEFSRKLGRKVQFERMPLDEYRQEQPERALMFEWFVREGHQVDLEPLRALNPELLSFEQWVNFISVPEVARV